MRALVVIAHNMRSTHNVVSLLRTAEGFGIQKVYFTGYTPYPKLPKNDTRLPHLAAKLDKAIQKTALGAEKLVNWEHCEDVFIVLDKLKSEGYYVCALEQTKHSIALKDFTPPAKTALVLGSEVTGIPDDILKECTAALVIPMYGKKESFNVVQAAAIALYELRLS